MGSSLPLTLINTILYALYLFSDSSVTFFKVWNSSDDDELSIFDIERCILTGKITERQKDTVTKEWKYIIEGQSVSGDKVGTVAKLSLTGKLFIITVYVV